MTDREVCEHNRRINDPCEDCGTARNRGKSICPTCGWERETFQSGEGTGGFVPQDKLLIEQLRSKTRGDSLITVTKENDRLRQVLDDVDSDLTMAEHDIAWVDAAREKIEKALNGELK